jgi:hypothetical protein
MNAFTLEWRSENNKRVKVQSRNLIKEQVLLDIDSMMDNMGEGNRIVIIKQNNKKVKS